MWYSKMFLYLFCFSIIVKSLWCTPWYTGGIQEWYNVRKAPLFEEPCMRLRGFCALSNACPPGMAVEHKGLCPEQQDQGMECCVPIPEKRRSKCCGMKGRCLPKMFECSQHSRVLDSSGCTSGEVCCIETSLD